jgi:hypothetical protein
MPINLSAGWSVFPAVAEIRWEQVDWVGFCPNCVQRSSAIKYLIRRAVITFIWGRADEKERS